MTITIPMLRHRLRHREGLAWEGQVRGIGPLSRARLTGWPRRASTTRPTPFIVLVPSRLVRPRTSRRCTQNGITDSAANIGGQYVDQHNLADVTNAGNSIGTPITPTGHENKSSNKRGRRKISVNTNIESSTSNVRPVNTNTSQPGSPYARAITPTANDLNSAHGFTYGSAISESTTRRPVNPTGQYGISAETFISAPSSPYEHELVDRSKTPRSQTPRTPHPRTGNPGHENIPSNSPSGSGGISETLARSKLRDETRGNQRSNVTQ